LGEKEKAKFKTPSIKIRQVIFITIFKNVKWVIKKKGRTRHWKGKEGNSRGKERGGRRASMEFSKSEPLGWRVKNGRNLLR